jgi:hypothetical protein
MSSCQDDKWPGEFEDIQKKAERLGVNVIGGDNWKPIKPFAENPVVGVCGVCGLEIRSVMWYSCRNNDCPVFVQVRL